MNLLEKMKHCSMKYNAVDGWYVLGYGAYWYVGLIKNNYVQRTKKVGKVQLKGLNYYNRACQIADQRNKKDEYSVNGNYIPQLAD